MFYSNFTYYATYSENMSITHEPFDFKRVSFDDTMEDIINILCDESVYDIVIDLGESKVYCRDSCFSNSNNEM